MGANLFKSRINESKDLFDISPKETWIYVSQFLDLKSLGRFAQVCKQALEIYKHDLVWYYKAVAERNFHLIHERKHVFNFSWRKAYLLFQIEFIKTLEILVGDRQNPEGRFLIQLLGNGKCYISERFYQGILFGNKLDSGKDLYYIPYNGIIYKMILFSEYDSPLYALKNDLNTVSKYIPFTDNHSNWVHIKNERAKLINDRVIDVVSFDPYILLLTEKNKIFEFAIYPEIVFIPQKYLIPTEVVLPTNDLIFKIKCTQIGNFALTRDTYGHTKVYFWSTINQINTSIVWLEPLAQFNIVDLNPISEQITEFYYTQDPKNNENITPKTDNKLETLTVRNVDIISLIFKP